MASEFLVLSDRKGRLSSVTEAVETAVGRPSDDICAGDLFELFSEACRDEVAEALRTASTQSMTVLQGVAILGDTADEMVFDISFEPAAGDRFWLRFTPAEADAAPEQVQDKERFLDTISRRLGLPENDGLQMFLVDFGALRDTQLLHRIGEDGIRDVRASIEDALSAASADGTIGRLDSSSYGVLGKRDQKEGDIVSTVIDATDRFGLSKEDLGAQSKAVTLDVPEESTGSVRSLLSHVCHKFYQTVWNGADFGSDRLSEVPAEIEQAVTLIETALDRDDLAIVYRDVRMIATGTVTMCMARGELIFGDERLPASRILSLPEHPDLCRRHDRAVLMSALSEYVQTDTDVPIIVDIYAPLLESGEAAEIASEVAKAGRTIGFRPHGVDVTATRSRAVRQIYQLLKDGFPVWLTNFSTAIAKTRQLHGAYVEVSATFLRDVSAKPDRNTLLSKLLKVWNDVEVSLVATNVDSKNLASFVSKLGIAFGVGIAADPAAAAPQSTRDMVA